MAASYLHDVFVSHNLKDKPWVRQFVRILKSHGLQCFFDEENIPIGADIVSSISRALEQSRRIVAILTPASLRSRWVAVELSAGLFQDPHAAEQRVLPVILETVNDSEIPLLLRLRRYANLADPTIAPNDWAELLRTLGITAQTLPDLPPNINALSQTTPPLPKQGTPPPANPRQSDRQEIVIIGMGYVGSSLAALLSYGGHKVVGVETDPLKAESLAQGRSHVLEPEVDLLIREATRANTLSVTTTIGSELSTAHSVVICVGPRAREDVPPSRAWETSRLDRVLNELVEALRAAKRSTPINIIVTSTLRPQDTASAIALLEDKSKGKGGFHYSFALNPLFLREGSMLADLRAPPFILVGTEDGTDNSASTAWGEILLDLVVEQERDTCPVICASANVASMVKLASNAFHAMKVTFANEIGRLCRAGEIDSRVVMELLGKDQKLNISNAYLQPGFAFGGSCLPKDITALLSLAETMGLKQPLLLGAIQTANQDHIEQATKLVQLHTREIGDNRIGILGLTFKKRTDDLRGSPAINLVSKLPRGYEIYAVDIDLPQTPDLTGANRSQWMKALHSHSIKIETDLANVVAQCRLLVLAKLGGVDHQRLAELLRPDHLVIDLAGDIGDPAAFKCTIRRFV